MFNWEESSLPELINGTDSDWVGHFSPPRTADGKEPDFETEAERETETKTEPDSNEH